ncbi:MAG: hypothetical protein QXE50_05850 [Nitrososphaerota archaeon]
MSERRRRKSEEPQEPVSEEPIPDVIKYMRDEVEKMFEEFSETRMELRKLARTIIPKPLFVQRLNQLRPLKVLKRRSIEGD